MDLDGFGWSGGLADGRLAGFSGPMMDRGRSCLAAAAKLRGVLTFRDAVELWVEGTSQ